MRGFHQYLRAVDRSLKKLRPSLPSLSFLLVIIGPAVSARSFESVQLHLDLVWHQHKMRFDRSKKQLKPAQVTAELLVVICNVNQEVGIDNDKSLVIFKKLGVRELKVANHRKLCLVSECTLYVLVIVMDWIMAL